MSRCCRSTRSRGRDPAPDPRSSIESSPSGNASSSDAPEREVRHRLEVGAGAEQTAILGAWPPSVRAPFAVGGFILTRASVRDSVRVRGRAASRFGARRSVVGGARTRATRSRGGSSSGRRRSRRRRRGCRLRCPDFPGTSRKTSSGLKGRISFGLSDDSWSGWRKTRRGLNPWRSSGNPAEYSGPSRKTRSGS
jgi:hypothetical protein